MNYLIQQFDTPEVALPTTIDTVDGFAFDLQKYIDEIHAKNPEVFCIQAAPVEFESIWPTYLTDCDAQNFDWYRFFQLHPDYIKGLRS